MRRISDICRAVLLNVPLILLYGGVLIFTGMVLYAYFMVRNCDPLTAGYVANGNQVIPYFVIDVMRDIPGLAGVFIAALFSGALSSLSSGINAMAANTIEDILGGMLKEATQTRITLFAKIIVVVYGLISVGLAYGAKNLKGSIVQIALSAMGAAGGPVTGLFFLGGIFPQANWIGALSGGIISLAITIWIAVGSVLYGKTAPLSPPPSTSGCMSGFTSNVSDILSNFTTGEHITTMDYFYTSSPTTFLETHSSSDVTAISTLEAVDTHLGIYDVSYLWLGMIGFVLSIFFGLIVSLATGMNKTRKLAESLIFPCCRSFWKVQFSESYPPAFHGQLVTKEEQMKFAGAEAIDSNVVHPPPWNRSWYLELPVEEPRPNTK
ncbi:hypothetical protein CHS0354_039431 [Potamilus streckersoni]|uniref:Sodium-coupled monocarboxylate transporter 1 n=1 Tax=Potamilus streckersoni TaxID=2493646 RepID=A0AAE0S1Y5_9BIVA|nr:hypothetical protein CHS0354_039431 [Potamilus streckersoni]